MGPHGMPITIMINVDIRVSNLMFWLDRPFVLLALRQQQNDAHPAPARRTNDAQPASQLVVKQER
eukprot:7461609-Karenia_brevis.AAC.1